MHGCLWRGAVNPNRLLWRFYVRNLSAWAKLWTIAAVGLVLVNLFVSYLSSKVVPFEILVPLSKQGYEARFEIDSFHSANYVLIIALDRPKQFNEPLAQRWTELDKQLRRDLDVDLELKLTDSKGRTEIFHSGSLKTWWITNATYTENGIGAFWKYDFDAKILESYTLDLRVLRSHDTVGTYNTTLLFHGIDDGYFFLVRPVLNVLWIALIGIIGLLVRLVRKDD